MLTKEAYNEAQTSYPDRIWKLESYAHFLGVNELGTCAYCRQRAMVLASVTFCKILDSETVSYGYKCNSCGKLVGCGT